MISEQQAIERANEFVAEQSLDCGPMTNIRLVHIPPQMNFAGHIVSEEEHYYRVEFAYNGPPIPPGRAEVSCPSADHPTVILVDALTGNSRLMYWL